MQYQGGKSRISKKIAEVIDNEVSRWQKSYSEVNSRGYRERERERVIATLQQVYFAVLAQSNRK